MAQQAMKSHYSIVKNMIEDSVIQKIPASISERYLKMPLDIARYHMDNQRYVAATPYLEEVIERSERIGFDFYRYGD
ncbi:MAG TPA: hypothetical protein DC032_09155 [Pseudomonas sp.]|nr:hypothetical protein [Pseudomonas sp.]